MGDTLVHAGRSVVYHIFTSNQVETIGPNASRVALWVSLDSNNSVWFAFGEPVTLGQPKGWEIANFGPSFSIFPFKITIQDIGEVIQKSISLANGGGNVAVVEVFDPCICRDPETGEWKSWPAARNHSR